MSIKLLVLTPDGKQRQIRIGDFDDVKKLVVDYTTITAENAQLKETADTYLRHIQMLADMLTPEQRVKARIALNAPKDPRS